MWIIWMQGVVKVMKAAAQVEQVKRTMGLDASGSMLSSLNNASKPNDSSDSKAALRTDG